jgi:predicted alpha/beta hydrolase
MNRKNITVPALDGFSLAATLYGSDEADLTRIIVINSGMGVPRTFYAHYARFLQRCGFGVLTYDYRGIGDSDGHSTREARLREWGESDLGGILEWLRTVYPDAALGCVGHSFGGQILGLTRHSQNIGAFLAVAAQSGYWRHWDVRHWPKLLFTWYLLVPLTTALFGHVPGALIGGQTLPKTAALDWARWCRCPHYLCDDDGKPLRPFFSRITCPVLFLAMADDHVYAPLRAVRELVRLYSATAEVSIIEPSEWGVKSLGHFGFFNRAAPRPLWQHTADWFDRHLKVP